MEQPASWLLIRGLARHTKHWAGFVAKVESSFADVPAFGIDLPGMGEFDEEYCPLTVEENVNYVRNFLRLREIPKPVGIIAMSFGGMVAFDWAIHHPDEVAAAILLNSSSADSSPFYKRMRWQAYLSFFGRAAMKTGLAREREILDLLVTKKDLIEPVAKKWEVIDREQPLRVKNMFRQLLAASRYRPRSKEVKTPILALVGAGDRLVSPDCSHAMAKNWGFDVIEHPWAGHDLTIDDPDWVLGSVKRWLHKNGHSSGS